jgi:hypothetical protein
MRVSQVGNYRVVAEHTALQNLNKKASIVTSKEAYGMNC